MHQVLQLDINGTPQAWITPEDAALYYATGTVAWELGDNPLATLRVGCTVAGLRPSAYRPLRISKSTAYIFLPGDWPQSLALLKITPPILCRNYWLAI